MTRLSLRQLEVFCSVAEAGSISQAARLQFISQPAISIQIKRLSDTVGTPLLIPHRGKGVTLTEAGRVLHQAAEDILRQERLLRHRLEEIRTGVGGVVSVGVSPTGALNWVFDTVRRFRTLRPGVEVDLQLELRDVILGRLQAGSVDLVVEWMPISDHSLEVIPLAEIGFGVAIAADHPAATGEMLSRHEFKELPYLAMAGGLERPGGVEIALSEAGIRWSVSSRFFHIDSLLRAVEAGLGVSVVSELSVQRSVDAGYVKWIPLEGFTLSRELVVVVARRNSQLSQVRSFLDLLRGE